MHVYSAAAAPPAPQQQQQQPPLGLKNPFLPYEEDLWVQHMSDTHTLLLNKFNIVPHHVLVVTRQFESQQDPLNARDLAATQQVTPHHTAYIWVATAECTWSSVLCCGVRCSRLRRAMHADGTSAANRGLLWLEDMSHSVRHQSYHQQQEHAACSCSGSPGCCCVLLLLLPLDDANCHIAGAVCHASWWHCLLQLW